MRKLKRIGQATHEFGVSHTVEYEKTTMHNEILCKKCYRGKAGPKEQNWEHPTHYGEVDSPEHCYQCGVLLPNSLTPEGIDYVKECLENNRGIPKVLELWRKQFEHCL